MGNPITQRIKLPIHYFILLSTLLLHLNLKSQENTQTHLGSWMVFSMENKLSNTWSIPVVGILCYENWAEQTEFGFIRTGISFRSSPSLKMTLGVAYVDSQPLYHHEFESLTIQFWLYEQATITTGNHFKHRFRLENRWIDKHAENIFNIRLRYRMAFKHKVTQNLYLKCTNEPFFNFDELHIDQNRFFLGLGSKISKDLSMEVGYFKTHVKKDNYDRIRVALHLNTAIFQKNPTDVAAKKINNPSK